VDTIDIGGGLPVPYAPDAAPFDIEAWAAGLAEVKAAYPRFALAVEPGRYLVAEAGALLLTVTQVVEKDGVRRVGADAGMNAILRPALYEAWHDIVNLLRADAPADAAFDVVGPVCESGDVLGRQRLLPAATAEGDVLLLADAGAYGHVMANTYNLRPLPAEDVLE
jgi:bifunctional diaminopimelate decarboxylase / aspartate kinase